MKILNWSFYGGGADLGDDKNVKLDEMLHKGLTSVDKTGVERTHLQLMKATMLTESSVYLIFFISFSPLQ